MLTLCESSSLLYLWPLLALDEETTMMPTEERRRTMVALSIQNDFGRKAAPTPHVAYLRTEYRES